MCLIPNALFSLGDFCCLLVLLVPRLILMLIDALLLELLWVLLSLRRCANRDGDKFSATRLFQPSIFIACSFILIAIGDIGMPSMESLSLLLNEEDLSMFRVLLLELDLISLLVCCVLQQLRIIIGVKDLQGMNGLYCKEITNILRRGDRRSIIA